MASAAADLLVCKPEDRGSHCGKVRRRLFQWTMAQSMNPRIAIFAPSSTVSRDEFMRGIELLRAHDFPCDIHPHTFATHFTYGGTDQQRLEGLSRWAWFSDIEIVMAARGGYGATRLLPMLDELTAVVGVPARKLLVGYSDLTALHAYVHQRWGWATLHAPMPSSPGFGANRNEWQALANCLCGRPGSLRFEHLQWLTPAPKEAIIAELVGGNLTVLAALCGTPYQVNATGRLLFIEDVGEPWYRLDRCLTQLLQSGVLKDARGIVLGDFHNCKDDVPLVVDRENLSQKIPLRPTITQDQALAEIFGSLGERLGLPVAAGVPAGHGPNYWPVPLHADYRLSPDGSLKLVQWAWESADPSASDAVP
ncbi:MAG: LD-carboxypeptidase [Tepidisphaeraceae bacterium]